MASHKLIHTIRNVAYILIRSSETMSWSTFHMRRGTDVYGALPRLGILLPIGNIISLPIYQHSLPMAETRYPLELTHLYTQSKSNISIAYLCPFWASDRIFKCSIWNRLTLTLKTSKSFVLCTTTDVLFNTRSHPVVLGCRSFALRKCRFIKLENPAYLTTSVCLRKVTGTTWTGGWQRHILHWLGKLYRGSLSDSLVYMFRISCQTKRIWRIWYSSLDVLWRVKTCLSF